MDSVGGYKKEGNLGGARHGDAYQVHVLMLLYERAVSDGGRSYADFRLATEMKAAGKFDDAVLSWQNGDSSRNWLFVQVKYRLAPIKLDEKHLLPDVENDGCKGDFSLYKYLVSFWEIKHLSEFKGNKQFVIFTNCGLGDSIQNWFADGGDEIERILILGINGERFMKLIAKDEHCEQLLRYVNSDFNGLAEIVQSILINGRSGLKLDLVKKYRGAIANKILVVDKEMVKFSPRFIKKKKLDHAERIFRGKLFQDDITLDQLTSYGVSNEELLAILTSKVKSCNTLPPSVDETEVRDFLNSLIFAFDQTDNDGMKSVIITDLKSRQSSPVHGLNSSNYYALLAYSTLQNKIHACLDSIIGMSLCREDLEIEFQAVQRTISSSRLSVQTDLFRGEMQNLRVELEDPKLPVSTYPAVIVTSTQNGLLACLKVYQILQGDHFFYFSLKDLQHRCILMELCDALREPKASFYLLLKDDGSKFEFASEILKAILPGNSIRLILLTNCDHLASRFVDEHKFTCVKDDEITLDQLTKSSQQVLRSKTVLFQGFEVELSELADDSELGKIIKDYILEKLLQNQIVTIGPALPELGVKHYVPRIITHSDTDDSSDDAENLEPDLNETLEEGSDKSSYSEERFLEDLPTILGDRRIVVLSSTSGMGKTTLWIKLAHLAKSRYRTKWIFYVKLQDCEQDKLDLDLVDILGNRFELAPLERTLLQCFLAKLDSIYIFFDGFDELPYAAMGPAIVLLRAFQQTTRIFVNTRTRLQLKLERAFKVDAFFLSPMRKSEQTDLFKSHCDFIDQPLSRFVEQLMNKIHSKSMQIASKFVGVPLIVNMLAEIYKPNTEIYLKTKDPEVFNQIELDALDIMELFEKFVYSSFQRQNIDKQNLSIDNRHTKLMLNRNNFLYRGFVKLHSILGLMSLIKTRKMHLIISDEQELQVLQQQIRLLDSPIISHARSFIHGSIAEFFAAKCLFRYMNRMNDEQILANFVINPKKRIPQKKHYLKDEFDLYYQVLRDYPTVRKFFFLTARQHEDCLDKLEQLLWCMRPYPLLWASEENFEELVKRLVQEDPTVINNSTERKETALHFAAAQGHLQICAFLINNNLNVDAKNIHSQTALHKAAANGCYEVVSLLIVRGATVDCKDLRLQTPLFLAAQAGHSHVVRLFIKQRCNLNQRTARGWNALHIAAFNNHIDVVELLLSRKVQMKIGGAKKWPRFLGYLLSRGFRELVILLVSYEVKSLKRTSNANQTLFWAIKRKHTDIVQAMHRAGTSIYEVDERSGLSTYQLSLKCGSFKAAEFILAVQKDLDTTEYPLHAAAEVGSIGCISILLERNAEVNATDQNGRSPLDLALTKCHVDAVRLLLDRSAKIGKTMLHTAIGANKATSAECVKALLVHGAEATAVDERTGRTPLHNAAIVDDYECTMLLLRNGASFCVKDNDGRTPLHYVAMFDSPNVLRAFYFQRNLMADLDAYKELVYARDKNGQTVIDIANETFSIRNVFKINFLPTYPLIGVRDAGSDSD